MNSIVDNQRLKDTGHLKLLVFLVMRGDYSLVEKHCQLRHLLQFNGSGWLLASAKNWVIEVATVS